MAPDQITAKVAILGAITGSIGTISGLIALTLQMRSHFRDRSRLRGESEFSYTDPDSPKFVLILRSVGRRPISVDLIRYYIRPLRFRDRLLKAWHHKHKRWIFNQELRSPIDLSEGKKTEIKINLPKGLDICSIYRVKAIDQTGMPWAIDWPSHKTLNRIATSECLQEFSATESGRCIEIKAYRLGESYFLKISFTPVSPNSGSISGQGFWFRDHSSCMLKMRDIIDNHADRYVKGLISRID